jgi:hypothetical protein
MTEDEALAPIAQQVMVAQLIEESKNPKATATKVYTIASQPDLSANAEQLKSQIYAQFDYNSLDVSSQILVQALIDALVKDLTDATQMATEQETLEGWREAAKLASARFL